MANDPFLGMLGLARRAGKLAFGDELVREMCMDKKARAVFVAADAGASTAKKAAFYAQSAGVPFVTLPHGKDDLGAAIGKNGCAVCAVSNIGLAAAALQKLASMHSEYAEAAAQLAEKNARIQSRRGKKKHRDKGAETQALRKAVSARTGTPQRAGDKKPAAHGVFRRTENKGRPTRRIEGKGKPVFDASRRPDKTGRPSRKPIDTPRAKRAFNRKSPRSAVKR